MASSALVTAAIAFVLAPSAKGSYVYFGHRLLLLAVAGLAGMYMVHLLADDYNTYQSYNRPRPKFLGKRSIPDDDIFRPKRNPTTPADAEDEKWDEHRSNVISRLDTALRFDPTECARKYVCVISTKSPKKLTQSERNIINMLRDVARKRGRDSGASEFVAAVDLGRTTRDPDACTDEYPKCLFGLSQMLKLANFF